MQAIIGKKVGMTQVFDENGRQIPVTVLEVGPCPVVQRKTVETDGYSAIQLGFQDQKPQRLDKARRGHFAKSEVAPKRFLREIIRFVFTVHTNRETGPYVALVSLNQFRKGVNITFLGLYNDLSFINHIAVL